MGGFRAVVRISVRRVSQSCGYSLPMYEFLSNRQTLIDVFDKKTPAEVDDYQILKNSFSIDGFPSLGHRMYQPLNPVVAMRLTDGKQNTPGAHDGYWFAFKDASLKEKLYFWLHWFMPCDCRRLRDMGFLCLGSALTFVCMRQRR